MTASELIAIKRPEDLFPGSLQEAKRVYRELARKWHPDTGGNASVFAHLAKLYEQAIDKLNQGKWEGATILRFNVNSREMQLAVRTTAPFEFGQALIGDDHVSYLIETEHLGHVRKLATSGWKFHYANQKMEDEIKRYLPTDLRYGVLEDGRMLIWLPKTPDLLRLRDVVTHLGALDPKHTAWIVSSLLNIACYFHYAGIVHHDISPDTYFISPTHHSGALLGGWWHACRRGELVERVPKRTYNFLPFKVRVSKQASLQTNTELIRATARESLGSCPEPMRSWLWNVGNGDAVDQYKDWVKVMEKTFGPRRFTAMLLDADTVYGSHTSRKVV